MKKILLFILVIILLSALPAAAKTKFKTMEELVTYLNLSGEMFDYLDFATSSKIDIDKCSFLINGSDSGLYTCPINYSTTLHVYTDKYLKPDMVVIEGPLDSQGLPKQTTFDWALAALAAVAEKDLYFQDILDIYTAALKSGFYEDKYNYVFVGSDNESNLWHFIINTK